MVKDTRIVQMQFDNKSFERNVATSQKSLERFKKELNFEETSRGLRQFFDNTKNLAFDTLSNNIQKLTDKFTGLGDAGEYVLSRLRASLEGAALEAERFVKSITLEQLKVGQNKYDALTKAVQTIVASGKYSEEEAYSVMERVMEYTNQTSHSFETLVGQISSLTSMGVPLEHAEKLMEGFANAATKAGADANKAAIAMQVYAKAMGSFMTKNEFDTLNLTARVVTQEWREQMIEAGLAAGDLVKDTRGVIRTAKQYGKQVEVTADTIENTLAKKWASKKTLAIFGEKYMFGETIEELKHPEDVVDSFGKTAYLTGQRALTFADGLNAVKESISGGWMTTFRLIFGDLTDAMNLWTGACNKVIEALEGIAEARNEILGRWVDAGGRDSLLALIFGEMYDADGNVMYEGAYGLLDIMKDVGDMISKGFWSMFQMFLPDAIYNESIETWSENSEYRFWVLGEMLKEFTVNIQDAIAKVRDFFSEKPTGSTKTRWEQIGEVVKTVFATIGLIANTISSLLYFFGLIRQQLAPSTDAIGNLMGTLAEKVGDSETDIVRNGRIKQFFTDLAETLKPFTDMINEVIVSITNLILAISESEEAGDVVKKIFASFGGGAKNGFKILARVLRPIVNFLTETIGIVTDLFRDGFTDENIEVAKEKFVAAFSTMFDEFKEIVKPVFDKVIEWFKLLYDTAVEKIVAYFNDPRTLGGKIYAAILRIIKVVEPVWEKVRGFFGNIVNRIRALYEEAENGITLWDMIKVLFSLSNIKSITGKLGELIRNGGLTKIIYGALGLVTLGKLIGALHNFKTVFGILKQWLTDPGFNLVTMIKQGVLGEYEWFSERFVNIAKAIMTLVAAVAILGFMDTDKMIQGILGLAAVMGIFALMFRMIGKEKATWTQQSALVATFAGLATAISILILALTPLMITDWDGFARAILGLGAVLTELFLFMYLAQNTKFSVNLGKLKGFFGFALSIGMLVLALTPLILTDWGGFARAILGLGVVLLELIGFMFLMQKFSFGTKDLNMKGMWKFALSISILMLSLTPFMIGDWGALARAVVGLGVVLSELIGFMYLMKRLSLSTKDLNFKGMYKFALSIAILMLSLTPMMLTDWRGMLRAVGGLAIVLGELLGFMYLMKKFDLSCHKLNFKGMYKFAIGVSIIMLSLIPLLLTDWSGMFRAVVGFGIVLAEIIGFMYLLRMLDLSSDGLDFKGIFKFSIGIGIIMLSLIPFLLTDWSGMFRAVVGLGLVLAELVGFMYLLQLIPAGIGTAKIAEFGTVVIAIGLLMLALTPLLLTDWSGMWRAVVGLGLVMLELVAFMAIVSVLPTNPAGIAAALAIALGLSVLAIAMSIAMNEVRNIKWEVITAFTSGLAVALMGMAAAIVILSAIPASTALKGVAVLAAGLAAIIGVLAIMVPIALRQLGSGLADFGARLELFSGLIEGFTTRMGNVEEGDVDKADNIITKLRTLIGKLYGWGNMKGDLDAFSYAMFVLGTGMEIFNTHVGSTISTLGTNGEAALKFIQDLSGCANDLDTISRTNYDALITRISGLGGALYLFAKGAQEAQGMEIGETPDVSGAMTLLQSISTGLTENGGFTIPENMPSEDALGTFGAQLAALALALISFEEAGSGLGAGTEKALKTLDFFRDLKNKLISTEFKKNLGATIGVFDAEDIKTNQLTEFGTNIEQLGLALKAFAQSTTVVDQDTGEIKAINLDGAINALNAFQELEGKLGWEWGPLIQFFVGRNRELGDLAAQLELMGTGIADVVNKLAPTDEEGNVHRFDKTIFDDALEVMSKVEDHLKELHTKLGRVGGLYGIVRDAIIGRSYDFSDLQTQMEAFAASVTALQSAKHEDLITEEELKTVYSVIDNVIAYLKKLRTDLGRVGGLGRVVVNAFIGRQSDFTDLKTQMEAFAASVTALSGMDWENLISVEELETIYPVLDSVIDYLKGEDGLSKRMGRVGGAYEFLKSSLVTGFTYTPEDLKKDLTAFSEGVASLTTFNVDKDGKTIFNSEETGAVFELLDSMITYMNGLGDQLPRVGGVAQFLGTIAAGRAATFEDLGRQLGYLGTGLGQFYKNLTNEAGTTYDSSVLNDSMASIASMVTILRQMAFMNDLLEDTVIKEGFVETRINNVGEYMYRLWLAIDYMANGYHGDPARSFSSIASAMAEFISQFNESLYDMGDIEHTKSAADILNNVSVALANLIKAASNMELDDGTTVDFNQLGVLISHGIAQGIKDGTNEVLAAATDLVTQTYEASRQAADINSPSKLFALIGSGFDEGIIMGIKDGQIDVNKAAEGMVNGANDQAASTMALLAKLLSEDIDANPTITPVLDLSNITSGKQTIDSLLGGTFGYGLNGININVNPQSIDANQNGTQMMNYTENINQVKGEISGMRKDIQSLSDSMSHLRLVMNTGEVVGAIGPDMDEYLGKAGFYYSRI